MEVTRDLRTAIEHNLAPEPYSYEGSLGHLQAQLDQQSKLITSLIEALYGRGLSREVLEEMLSCYDLKLELNR